MPAEIFGERFYGFREPAWHRIGEVFTEPISVSEAVEKAGLDYKVGLEPLYYGENFVPVARKKAIVRGKTVDDPQERVFGIVGDSYQVVTNQEIARLVDPLVEKWPLDAIGALGRGETIFVTLNAGEMEVGGEEVQQYFLLTDRKDGKGALTIAFVPLRVVCQNTLITGLRGSSVSVSVRHFPSISQETRAWVDLVRAAEEARAKVLDVLKMMTRVKLTALEVENVLAAAYPYPSVTEKMALYNQFKDALEESDLAKKAEKEAKVWSTQFERATKLRASARELLQKFNDEAPDLADSAWAIYNAVVELEDWRDGRERSPETSSLFGMRADRKRKAFAAVLQSAQQGGRVGV